MGIAEALQIQTNGCILVSLYPERLYPDPIGCLPLRPGYKGPDPNFFMEIVRVKNELYPKR